MPTPTTTRTSTRTLTDKHGTVTVITTTVDTYDPCPFTHSHTQTFCGHPGCRVS